MLLPLTRKSDTDTQTDLEKILASKNAIGEGSMLVAKLTPIPQRTPSSTSRAIKNIPEPNINTSRHLALPLSSDLSVMNVDLDLSQANKIPHPPPQSTRPANSSARKLRLSSAVKTNKPTNNTKQTRTTNTNKSSNNLHTGESSSNEEDIGSFKNFHFHYKNSLISYFEFISF